MLAGTTEQIALSAYVISMKKAGARARPTAPNNGSDAGLKQGRIALSAPSR